MGILGGPWGVPCAERFNKINGLNVFGWVLGPWGPLGGHWRSLEGPWGVPWRSYRVLGLPFGMLLGCLEGSCGTVGRLMRTLKNHYFLFKCCRFLGAHWGSLGGPAGGLGGPRGILGSPSEVLVDPCGSLGVLGGSFGGPWGPIRQKMEKTDSRLGDV